MEANDVMGEVEDMHLKEDSNAEHALNGDTDGKVPAEEMSIGEEENAEMDVDEQNDNEGADMKSNCSENPESLQDTDSQPGDEDTNQDGDSQGAVSNGMDSNDLESNDLESNDVDNPDETVDLDNQEEDEDENEDGENPEYDTVENLDDDDDENDVEMLPQPQVVDDDDVEEVQDDVQEIDDDDPEIVSEEKSDENGLPASKTIELNDSTDNEVSVVEVPKENGKSHSGGAEVISIETAMKKAKEVKKQIATSPRRSSRNVNKQKSYSEEPEIEEKRVSSDESDIEEVLPEDPLAVGDDSSKRRGRNSSTIVVKDTKRLVEIAAKSTPGSGKKEPTLVIIDTNSILSGRGPVAIGSKSSSFNNLPAALPAQGLYPANMRATITPIPLNQSRQSTGNKSVAMQRNVSSPKNVPSPKAQASPAQPQAPILPSLTDDMFVVEAPSFIVPYVYEKPPLKELKEFVKDMKEKLQEQIRKEEEEAAEAKKAAKAKKDAKGEGDYVASEDSDSDSDASDEKEEKKKEKKDDDVVITGTDKAEGAEKAEEKAGGYFESPVGKFFSEIGYNLVQEFVQTDLLKQQKRKRDREQGQNSRTNKTIQSLLKNLEYSKENNGPLKMEYKKCEFCSFKTESALAMAFHLETPHMKNYIYRCNFCPFEVRSPHDILFHMEAEHAIRGRLERAPAFHQCPNCPFEDNQKGKLSRHAVACARKFKPERNMEPPIDWEPPAKIPRITKMKQPGFASAFAYQSKPQQYQMLAKMQPVPAVMNRGRGRPTLASLKNSMVRTSPGMVYKQMSGGSVLVPTNYQLTGSQLFQVIGNPDMGARAAPGNNLVFPGLSAPSSTVAFQSNQKKPSNTPSISITPLPRGTSTPTTPSAKPGDSNLKSSFVICEICDGYIKDLEQLRNHMHWIHKVKIHPKMIHNRPPLNCQKCQFRFFTDQGLERHLLGSHGLVTSSMQEAANRSKDAGRCPVCGRVYQWKLLNHVARDHNMTLKPAHLSYKCTVCTATFGMYKQFESHVYSAHSVVAKRVMDKKTNSATAAKNDTLLKPLKINDEITIIPQAPKAAGSKEDSTSFRNGPSTSKST